MLATILIYMKFAIPTNDDNGLDSRLSVNFSKCKFFLLVSLDNGKIGAHKSLPHELPANLEGVRGAEAFLLSGKGVQAAIVDKIIEKDRLSLVGNNIRIFIGASGTASDAIKQYFNGELKENSECKSGDICEC
jgi:predicted Fe-Mo cluster-binding NifX family protein